MRGPRFARTLGILVATALSGRLVLACASAGTPDPNAPVDAKLVDASGGKHDAPSNQPIDAPAAAHDAPVAIDAPPPPPPTPDADTTGAVCSTNAQCTTTGQCCLIITSGVGLCSDGHVIGGTCLPI